MKHLNKVMKALSDTNRLKIVKILQKKEMCVCEIQFCLGLAQSSISKHLKILEQAGLVESRKKGLWVDYFLSNGEDNAYAGYMLENLQHWINDDPEILDALEKASQADRVNICKG